MKFEINLISLQAVFSNMSKKKSQNIKYLENETSF